MPKSCIALVITAANAGLLHSATYVVHDDFGLPDIEDDLLKFALQFREPAIEWEDSEALITTQTVTLLAPPHKIASPDTIFIEPLFARCTAYLLSKIK